MATQQYNHEADAYQQNPSRAAQYQQNQNVYPDQYQQQQAIQMQMQQQYPANQYGQQQMNQYPQQQIMNPYPQQQMNPYPQQQMNPYPQQQMNPYPQQVPQDLQNVNNMNDAEQAERADNAIMNCIPALRGKTDRQNFVIKVYSLIACMLAVTSIFTALMVTNSFGDSKKLVLSMVWLYYFSVFMVIGTMCAIVCKYQYFRKYPANYISLAVYTVFHSYLVGACSAFYTPETVLTAAICTMTMFIGLTTYAIFTKTDMTYLGGFLVTGGWMIFLLIIFMSFFRVPSIAYTILIMIIVCFLSLWIIYDTQVIIGGNKYNELQLDDYCIGALIIYSDIVTIFLYLLQLCGGN